MPKEIKPSDLHQLKSLGGLKQLLKPLREIGCQRDKANNRTLHMDQYCLLLAAWLFNPVVSSMRGIQQVSCLKKVQKRLGVGRASLGSLSESVAIFDPEPLARIASELSDKIPTQSPKNLENVTKKITAVDGSVFKVLAQIGRLAWLPQEGGKASCGYRLHAQFEVLKGTPSRIDVTGSNPKGDADERVVLERTLESGRCYLMDRGYIKFSLWNAINEAKSDYVCRLHDKKSYEVLSENELTPEAKAKNVISDQIVRFGTASSRSIPNHTTRVVIVKIKPHDSRRKKNATSGPSSDGFLRIVTNNLNAPAEVIADLYELRWTVEIYFRIIKQLLGCRHLLSHDGQGVELQMYMAIIVCILILSMTGKMPTKRTYEMISFYLAGWASLEELEVHIKKLQDK